MVFLFCAYLLSSTANASIFNFWGQTVDEKGNLVTVYEPPPIVEGPVIKQLRDHFCTGGGEPLYLTKDVVYNAAFKEEMELDARLWAEQRKILVRGQEQWDDKTIFADIPFDLTLWETGGLYHGLMREPMAKLLSVDCGEKKLSYYTIRVED